MPVKEKTKAENIKKIQVTASFSGLPCFLSIQSKGLPK